MTNLAIYTQHVCDSLGLHNAAEHGLEKGKIKGHRVPVTHPHTNIYRAPRYTWVCRV